MQFYTNSYLDDRIFNINVQGKRGNIAQVRNCFEYDFVPNNLTIFESDYVHFQWVGSDFNPLNNDGEGRADIDPTNLVDITDYFGFNRTENNTFIPPDLIDSFTYLNQLTENCYTYDELVRQNKIVNTQYIPNCALLNNASVYFNSRIFKILLKSNITNKTYLYMSTRNNNFSNRDQKGYLIVLKKMTMTTTTTTTTTTLIINTFESSSSSSRSLEPGYTAMIVILILMVIGSIIYYIRNKTQIDKKSVAIKNNIIRSFSTSV